MSLFTFKSTFLLEMMLPFFLLLLLGFPWVDTTVNNTTGLDNSTSSLSVDIEARQCKYDPKTPSVLDGRRIHLELTKVRRRLA